MNILIVGGSGFIGKYLTESLLDFGQSVSIIDIADKPKKLNKKAAYYKIDAISKECREIFEIGQFDIVYFSIGNFEQKSWLDCKRDISPLLNILDLSCEFKIKKFIYLSTSYLYTYEAMNHKLLYKAYPKFFLYCENKKNCESYCNIYKDVDGLNMLIIRIPSIYGPRLNGFSEGSIILDIFDAYEKDTYREVWAVFKDIEMVYIADVIRTLTTTALASSIKGNYKIKGDVLDVDYIIRKARGIFSKWTIKVNYKIDTKMKYPLVENTINRLEDNTPFADGFSKTYEWYNNEKNKKKRFADKFYAAGKIKRFWGKYKSLIEATIFSFLIIEFMKYTSSNYDLAIALIMVIGLNYGIGVSVYTGVLCMILNYYPFTDLSKLDLHILEMFLAYFSVALISGYKKSVEIKKRKIKAVTKIELEELFKTIQADLVHTRKSASLLTEQLKTYEYSYLAVYNAIKRLGESTSQITQILPEVISDLTGFKDVTLETNKDLHKYEDGLESEIIKKAFERNEVYFNTKLKSSIKIIIPVFNKKTDRVDSLIVIRNIPFEKMNVNVESQMHFVYNLVTDFYNKVITKK